MTPLNWGRLAFVLVTALIVQVAVLDDLSLGGAHPDVMVLLAAAAGFVAGSSRGATIAFVVGCFADLVVDTPYGLSLLTFVLLAFGCGLLRFVAGDRATTTTATLATIAAGAVGTLLFAVIGSLVGQHGMFERSTGDAVLVVAASGIVLAPIALASIRWATSGSARTRPTGAIPSGGSAAG